MAAAPASGISETAALVRRKHSFAVSGTPIRGDLDDLAGLFKFLGFSLDSDNKAFKAFFKNPDILADVVHKIAIRTVKTKVEHELVLPGQDRFIVPLQFGPIERTSYRGLFFLLLHLHLVSVDRRLIKPTMQSATRMRW